MERNGYGKTIVDHCIFVKKFYDSDYIIILLYIDDMFIVGHDTKKIQSLKKELRKSFAMKELGPAQQIFGMRIIVIGRKVNCGFLNTVTFRRY